MSNFKSTKTEYSGSLFGEVIFSYTRAQAIADRVLVDITPTALEAGFRFPVAATAALMTAIQMVPQQYAHQDAEGRLWDVMPSHRLCRGSKVQHAGRGYQGSFTRHN